MINTKQLRRGNLIAVTQEEKPYYCIVDRIEETRICVDWVPAIILPGMGMITGWADEEMVSGIPISEEWLKKFDFMQQSVGNEQFLMSDIAAGGILIGYHNAHPSECSLFQWTKEMPLAAGHVKYLHQLQNLFFSISGRELKMSK